MESLRLWTEALQALNGLAASTGFAITADRCASMKLATIAGMALAESSGPSPLRAVSPACMTTAGPWAVTGAAHSTTIADEEMARSKSRRRVVVEKDAIT